MSAGFPESWSSPPLSCDGFLARVHARAELLPLERREFDRHGAACRACARVLLECERLDDLLLQWRAPEPARAGADDPARGNAGDDSIASFDERVLQALRGEGPTASCAEATASLHHFVAGDLEPWLAARVERHVARCAACRDHLDEVQHSRKVWLAWSAPEPAEGFADRIVRRLEPATRAARRRRQIADLFLGAIPVPRIAAGLVLASLTLLAVGVLRSRVDLPVQRPTVFPGATDGSTETGFTRGNPNTYLPTRYAPAGSSDPTDSFSPELTPGSHGSLKRALRGH